MSDVRVTKRKADDLEPAAEAEVPDLKKRAKKDEEVVIEAGAGDGSDEDSEDDLEDELKALAEEAPVLQRRTRGVRVDYTQLKVDEEEEEDDEDEEDEENEENEEDATEAVKENGHAEEGSEEEADKEQNGHDEDEE